MNETLQKVWEHTQRRRQDRNCLILVAVLIALAQGAATWMA